MTKPHTPEGRELARLRTLRYEIRHGHPCPTCGGWAKRGRTYCSKSCGVKANHLLQDHLGRVFAHIEADTGGCWLWTGPTDRDGYARQVGWYGALARPHRLIYEVLVGPIPDGLQIDHLCRVKRCVNPEHLEPVTTQENTRRGLPFRRPRGPNRVHA